MSINLTAKQLKLLEVITQYRAYFGKCPTYQMLGNLSGRSRNSAWKMCQTIIARGHLTADKLGKIKIQETKK